MIYIVKQFEKDGKDFILIQLATSCCKDRILFEKIAEDKYYNWHTLEECPPGWNKLIEQAIKNQDWLPEYLRIGES